MTTRTRVLVLAVLVLAGITGVLLYNKSRLAASSRGDFKTSIPVTVATVSDRKVSETLSLIGTITPSNDVAIVAETAGKVTGVLVQVGDAVKAGSPLVQLDDEIKKALYEQAEANYQRSKRDNERIPALFADHTVSESQRDNAYAVFRSAEAQYVVAKRQYHDTKICSPIDGIVTARTVELGTMVNDRMVIGNVVDVRILKVKLSVAESDAFKLKKGDRVEITTDVYPGTTFEGKISSISAKSDEGHTYPVEIVMNNSKEHPLRAGMFGRVNFVSIASEATLAVPREALVGSLREPRVFVIEGTIARERSIVVSGVIGNDLAVQSGLSAGQQVVVNGQNNLKDSVTVEVMK
jgi:RND family efflux transporter MFP subunit